MNRSLTYDWNGHKDIPMAAPHLSDFEVAGKVRMLMRDQLDHEAVCTLARDRIMALSKEVERLEAERAEQWRLRREAEASRDVEKSVSDSLKRDAARLEDAVRIYLEAIDSDPEKDVLDEENVSFASDWSHRAHDAKIRSALADLRAALAERDAI